MHVLTGDTNRVPAKADWLRALASWLDTDRVSEGPRMTTFSAPHGSPEKLLNLFPHEDAHLWMPPRGPVSFGLGVLRTFGPEGETRFDVVRDDASQYIKTLRQNSDGIPGLLTLHGGFSFSIDDTDGPWEPFGDARFVLPRWTVTWEDGRARISLAIDESRDARSRYAILEEASALWEALADPAPIGDPGVTLRSFEQTAESDWAALVQSIREEIHEERFKKIVAARRSTAVCNDAISLDALIHELGSSYPECYRFVYRKNGVSFLGATPERLIRKEGAVLSTEALAGSIGSPGRATEDERTTLAAELLSSEKDRDEHAIVVDAIRGNLEPLCAGLTIEDVPTVRSFKHVLHLQTPIQGTLSSPDSHVLDIVARLHPTPSVGGVPSQEAVCWIGEHEPIERGWYAGPIGWFDESGDGEFAVALRCGLLDGERLHLYAGAGIVRDSDPHNEYVETDIKQLALLRALGVRSV